MGVIPVWRTLMFIVKLVVSPLWGLFYVIEIFLHIIRVGSPLWGGHSTVINKLKAHRLGWFPIMGVIPAKTLAEIKSEEVVSPLWGLFSFSIQVNIIFRVVSPLWGLF